MLVVAHAIAAQGTCKRRRVGCVLVDEEWVILSTGYNGVGPDQPHCIDVPCAGAGLTTGEGLDKCEAIHAEQNALLTCADIRRVSRIYCTVSPCIHCTKMLLRTKATELYFLENYPNNSGSELWSRSGRQWIYYQTPTLIALQLMSSRVSVPHGMLMSYLDASARMR